MEKGGAGRGGMWWVEIEKWGGSAYHGHGTRGRDARATTPLLRWSLA